MADFYARRYPAAVTVACAGTNQATGTALVLNVLNNVTGADGTKGVTLPAAAAGDRVAIYSPTATNALPVYPASGGKINDGSANAALSVTARKLCILECIDGTNWAACLGS